MSPGGFFELALMPTTTFASFGNHRSVFTHVCAAPIVIVQPRTESRRNSS